MACKPPSIVVIILSSGVFTLSGCGGHGTAPGTRPPTPSPPTVDAGDADGRPVVRAEELMIGRFPGVRVIRRPGGGIAVRVWGPSTFVADKEPLYVIDGLPVSVTPGRGLDWLNPGDIQTIRVLKDVSETAVWGVRGANGVVVITTRRGRDAGGR